MPGNSAGRIEKRPFGCMPDGTPVDEYLLTSGDRLRLAVVTYGGVVTRLEIPDRNGGMGNVTLGFERLDDYRNHSPYFGCITGRYANRIGGAKFTLDGVEYRLPANNGANTLHGGPGADTRGVLSLGTAQRNTAAALVVAGQNFDDAKVVVMITVVMIVSFAVLMPLAGLLAKRRQPGDVRAAAAR